jgi:parallel beta-helix repeat protein
MDWDRLAPTVRNTQKAATKVLPLRAHIPRLAVDLLSHIRMLAAAGGALVAIGAIGALPVSAANVLNVPGTYPTIQTAINASSNGDTVLAAPGTYFENIDFKGKLITVQSAQGPSVTTIDGGGVAPVANFSTGETQAAVLQGFTLQHGNAPFAFGYEGAGVHISGASPTIAGNVITANTACADGTGISVAFASPVIRDNTISSNSKQPGCSGQGGGGISVRGAASAQIIHNTITNNTSDFGGGVELFASGTPTLLNNTISNNTAGIQGGGVYMVNQSDVTMVQNLVTGNTSAQNGGGLYISIPSGDRGPLLVNNTVAGNSGSDTGVFLGGFDAQVQLSNNIIAASTAQPAVRCDTSYSATSPIFDHNDLFNSTGPATQGSCSQAVGANGNISADPQFVAAGDYHLPSTSPAIDAGNNAALSLPASDLDGRPRVNGIAVDQGVYEVPRPLSLTTLSAIAQVEGASASPVLAHFSGGYGPWTASIAWGDGQFTAATISANAVSGTHAYLEEGSYTVTVTLTDSTNATATGTTSAGVTDAALSAAGSGVNATEGAMFTGAVASFTDADPNGAGADYSATINWGDQTSSPGTIAAGGGGFVVIGTHTYAEEGAHTVTVTISDAGGATASPTSSATVSDAALTATGRASFREHHRNNFTATVATLTDADPGGASTDYTGQITWGDGTTSAATVVSGTGGAFTVSGSHNYRRNGTYTVTIQLTDAGGSSASTTTTIVVS